jgi:hypothetical protein
LVELALTRGRISVGLRLLSGMRFLKETRRALLRSLRNASGFFNANGRNP